MAKDLRKLDLSTKGKRLRYLRELAHLERAEMAEIARVAYVTYKDWENGLTNLPDRRAQWLVDGMQEQGLKCAFEWLVEGDGSIPERQQLVWDSRSVFAKGDADTPSSGDEQKHVIAELEFFCKRHANAIGYVVADDAMLPNFAVDDVVAGIQCFDDDIQKVCGLNCIVKLANGNTLVRNLQLGREPGLYTLLCLNPNPKLKSAVMHDVKLISAAPVVWHRKQFSVCN